MSKSAAHRIIYITIWDDPDWRRLSAGAQWTYFMLLTQKDLSKAGTMSYNPRKWAKGCESLDEAHVERCIYELQERQFVYLDEDTDEVLIRTYIRNDGIWKQPNMLKSACRAAALVSSAVLRESLAFELSRIPESSNASTAAMVSETLTVLAPAGVPESAPKPFPNPSGNPSAKGSETLPGTLKLAETASPQVSGGFGNPSRNPSGTLPERVGGGGGGYCSSKVKGSSTPPKEREDDKSDFQAFCDAYPKAIGGSQQIETRERWRVAVNAHGTDRVLKATLRYADTFEGHEAKFAKNPVVWLKDDLYVEHLPDELEPRPGMDVVAWLDRVTELRDVNTAKRYATGDDFMPEWPAEYVGWTKAEADAFRESDKDRWFRQHRELHLEVLGRRYGGVSDVA